MIGKFIDNDNHERQRTNSALSNLMDAFPIRKKKKLQINCTDQTKTENLSKPSLTMFWGPKPQHIARGE